MGVTMQKRGTWWWLDISQDGKRFRKPTHTQDKKKADRIRHELESAILAGEWNVALALETTVARGIERFQAFITARRGQNVTLDQIGKCDIEAYQMHRSKDVTIRKAPVFPCYDCFEFRPSDAAGGAMRAFMVAGFLLGLGTAGIPQTDDPIGILFVREKGIGSAAQLQPFVDKLGALVAAKMQWSGVRIPVCLTRDAALRTVPDLKPRYALLTLRTFLALRQEHRLEVVGHVEWTGSTKHYHVVSRTLQTLEACKGKTMISYHTDDVRFIDKVVFKEAAKLADFTPVSAARPMQAVKKLAANEADCALLDDSQLAELPRVEGAAGIRSIWSSAALPQMIVAAFPSASAADRKRFMESFGALPQGDGQQLCKDLGIDGIRSASDADLKEVIQAYEKKE